MIRDVILTTVSWQRNTIKTKLRFVESLRSQTVCILPNTGPHAYDHLILENNGMDIPNRPPNIKLCCAITRIA